MLIIVVGSEGKDVLPVLGSLNTEGSSCYCCCSSIGFGGSSPIVQASWELCLVPYWLPTNLRYSIGHRGKDYGKDYALLWQGLLGQGRSTIPLALHSSRYADGCKLVLPG